MLEFIVLKDALTTGKTKQMKAINQAWKFKGFLKSDNIEEVLNATNKVVEIYKVHEQEVKQKCELKDFNSVEGVDFNTWAYTQQTRIEQLYNDLKSKYHDLLFQKYQFNAY